MYIYTRHDKKNRPINMNYSGVRRSGLIYVLFNESQVVVKFQFEV